MLELSLGDVCEVPAAASPNFPNGLRDQPGAHLLNVPFRASGGAGQIALLAGPGVRAQVDMDSPGSRAARCGRAHHAEPIIKPIANRRRPPSRPPTPSLRRGRSPWALLVSNQ